MSYFELSLLAGLALGRLMGAAARQKLKDMLGGIPLGRPNKPAEVAEFAAYFDHSPECPQGTVVGAGELVGYAGSFTVHFKTEVPPTCCTSVESKGVLGK